MDKRKELKERLTAEIKRLARTADICVFSVHDPSNIDKGPKLFEQYEKSKLQSDEGIPVELNYNGIGVWYICYRHGETFTVRHILLKIENGKFLHQQTGVFEGYWEDWPKYVAEDRWLQSNLVRNPNKKRSPLAG